MNHKKLHKYLYPIIFSYIIITVHSQITTSTTPNTNSTSYILSCGANNDTTDSSGIKWTSDTKFLTSKDSSSATAQSQDPALPSTVPYMTARILKSESTYKFSISPENRHWVRLHFYPTPYNNNFDPKDSYLKVTAGGLTLLNNFSASVTADAQTLAYIVKEFTITKIESGNLELTFTPCNNSSQVFVNGIEVIPMPEIFKSAQMVGAADSAVDLGSYAMATMFRLNVGGQYIAANNDSGSLSRTWYDDSSFIYGAGFGVTTEADKNVTIAYPSKEAEDVAPVEIYRTSRSMGPNATVNENYNLTWIFEVDVNFTYLVRLHLCEYKFTRANQMVFIIYINNRTAESVVDLIGWTGRRGVPTYRDFATYVNGKNGDNNLWLALHPNVASHPEFSDAALNGIEIFKLDDSKMNLAGPNPVPSPLKYHQAPSKPASFASSSEKSNKTVIIGSVSGTVAAFGLVVGLVFFVNRKRKDNKGFSNSNFGGWLPIYGSSQTTMTTGTSKTGGSSRISNLGGGLCRHFSLAEIKLGTDNFSESHVIGVGGFGKVYKGFVDGNSMKVAIKRANPSSDQGVHEFLNEIELLSKLRHRHLVSLIGACEENNEMILVYDYMANGTLREHLYKNNNPPLSWEQRLGICIGASRGIHYLHTGAKYTIIHRDVKSTNILLDDKWVAKVSDFGLSKTGPTMNQTHVSTVVKGSFGYLDPEYFRRQQLTEKSDVYSFGVVLFEVLCGRPALNPSLSKEQVSLADWAIINHKRGTLGDIVDPHIKGEVSPICLKHFSETAAKCLSDHGLERPAMGDVLWNLEYCLQLQANPDGPKVEAKQKATDAYAMHATLLSIEEGDEKEGKGERSDKFDDDHSANAAFSQIVNPTGR